MMGRMKSGRPQRAVIGKKRKPSAGSRISRPAKAVGGMKRPGNSPRPVKKLGSGAKSGARKMYGR